MISGLTIDLQKSSILGIGRDSSDALRIVVELQCGVGSLPIHYLGFPLGGRMLDSKSWDHMISIFRSKLF